MCNNIFTDILLCLAVCYKRLAVKTIIMVASSSVARERLPLYFAAVSLFSSLATLSQTSENRHPRNFPTRRGLVFNRTFAIEISPKCPLKAKTNGAEKSKICTIFLATSQTISGVVR